MERVPCAPCSPYDAQVLLLHLRLSCPRLSAKIALVETELESGWCPSLKLFPAGPDPPDVLYSSWAEMGSGRHAELLLPDDPDCPVHLSMTLLCASLVRDAALGPHHLLAVIFKEHLLCACWVLFQMLFISSSGQPYEAGTSKFHWFLTAHFSFTF